MDRHSVLPPLVTLIITDKKWSFRTHVRPVDLQAIGDFICRFPTSPSIIIKKSITITAGIFGVGRRPKPRAAKPREKSRAGHYKDLTETGNRARKVSGTQGTGDEKHARHI